MSANMSSFIMQGKNQINEEKLAIENNGSAARSKNFLHKSPAPFVGKEQGSKPFVAKELVFEKG